MDAQTWDQLSTTYFEQISSPFEQEVVNPLPTFLEALPGREDFTVADLGCGIGNLLPFLAERFRKVVAVDFSSGMLRQARARGSQKNVVFYRRSLANLSHFRGQFDVVVTVNSVLSPKQSEVDQILKEIAGTLKPGGTFAGIFPSMESVLYEGVLMLEKEREQAESEEEARKRVSRLIGPRRYDFVSGLYTEGTDRQKFYYSFELRRRLQAAGFRNIQFGKVLYPWTADHAWFNFSGEPRMWDWFVRATVGRGVRPQ
jgi:SAM-dependent methyltransferase